MGVSLDDALRRLHLQDRIGELNGELAANEPEAFAGLWIQNSPDYRVIVLFTRNGEETIKRYIADGPLESLVEVRDAHVSLKVLEAAQPGVMALANRLGEEVHTGRNLADNIVELYVHNKAQFAAVLKRAGEVLPPSVRIVEARTEVREVADLYGGLRLDTSLPGICTSGFSVVKPSTGEKGIATAAHCTDPIRYSGTQLFFGGEYWQNGYDISWYKSSGFTVRNWIWTGSSNRSITSTKALPKNYFSVSRVGLCGAIT